MRDLTWFGPEPDEKTLMQAYQCMQTGPVHGMALMADNHLGYGVPIGGVVAYKDAISPSGVGFDIGCGVKAIRTNLSASRLLGTKDLDKVLDEIQSTVEFGMGRKNDVAIDHPVMDSPLWDEVPQHIADLKSLAAGQLGTVGAGNHYVDILIEEHPLLPQVDAPVWVACHFGSRGFGHKTASWFLKRANAKDDMMSAPAIIEKDDYDFEPYILSMGLAGEYAYAGRDIVLDQVLSILGTKATATIHNHHNYAWLEEHDGEELYVVRKGATPAAVGQMGFVGGSMGDIAAVVMGLQGERSRDSYRSTVHGAGRLHSRTWAKGKINRKTGEVKSPGNVSLEQMHGALAEFGGVKLRGGDVDESPFVYRKLAGVLEAQGDTIQVNHTLRPIGVVMAGANTYDAFKD